MHRGTGLATAHPQHAAIVVAVALTALIIALLGLMAVPASARASFYDDYRDVVLGDNPSIYWRFDESSGNASDASGNGRTGYYFGSPYQQGGTGINGANDPASKAVHFNDGNARSVSTHNPFIPYYVQSFEAWVCRDDDGLNDDTVFSGTGGDDGKSPYLALSSNGTSVIFDPNSGGSNVTIWGGVPNVAECNPNDPLEWTHLVVVVNTSPANPPGIYHDSAALYVNGQNVGWKLLTVTDNYESDGAPEDNFQVGARYHNGIDKPFDGRVDEVAVYPRLLSPGEIQDHYNAGRRIGINTFGTEMFGFSTDGTTKNQNAADLAQDMAAIKAAGAEWVRVEVDWSETEGTQGVFNWTKADAVIGAARAEGLKVLALIAYTPTWARTAPGTDNKHAPSNPAHYASFCTRVVNRYKPQGVDTYEIWNEPNITAFWKPSPNVANYTTLLQVAYAAIQAADPAATVIAGATAPVWTDGTNYHPNDFLQGIYDNGGQGEFDAVSHHPYTYPHLPSDNVNFGGWTLMNQRTSRAEAGARLPSMREVMMAAGDGAKKIWATEFGAPSRGGGHTEQTQADQIETAYHLWRYYGWAGPLFVYEHRDQGTGATEAESFGLLNNDYSEKPGYAAYEDAAAAHLPP